MKIFLSLLMVMPLAVFGAADKMKMPMMDNDCPMTLGADVAVSDTSDGVILTFTAKPPNVAELQRRVGLWATMHSADRLSPAMMQGMRFPATVKYVATENGAALTMTPRDPAKLNEFRARVRARVEEMKTGDWMMMRDMMQGMMKGMMRGMMMGGMDDHSGHHPEEK